MRADERVGEALDRQDPTELLMTRGHTEQLVRVLLKAPFNGDCRPAFHRHRGRPPVEAGERLCDDSDLCTIDTSLLHRRRERGALVVAAHLDEVVDRRRIVHIEQHGAAVRIESDASDTKVDIGCEPAVEPDLLIAHPAPPLGRPVVEKRKHERLLELVGEPTGKEDERDVRLTDSHRFRAARIRVGSRQRGHKIVSRGHLDGYGRRCLWSLWTS